MYCKYCGSRIASDTTKCVSCGANIDLNDGGQSFFDDNELNAWQSDSISYNAQSSVPRTEMREPLPEKANFEEEYEKTFARPQASVSTRGNRSRARSKKKKNVLDYLNLSSSNKLIIFCIASALAIVLLVVAIIAVLNSVDDTTDENATQTNTSGYTTTADSTGTDQNNNIQQQQTNQTEPEARDNQSTVQNTSEKEKEPIKDVIIKKGNDVVIEATMLYRIDGVEYVALYDIVKNEGYKNKVVNNKGNHVFDYKENEERRIEVATNGKEIWFKDEKDTEAPEPKHLKYNTVEIEGNIYVPAEDFLNKFGFKKYKFDKDANTLTYSK